MALSVTMMPPCGHALILAKEEADELHVLYLIPSTEHDAVLVRVLVFTPEDRPRIAACQEPVQREEVPLVVEALSALDWSHVDWSMSNPHPPQEATWFFAPDVDLTEFDGMANDPEGVVVISVRPTGRICH